MAFEKTEVQKLREQIEQLTSRLEESEETLRAIRSGSVDAIVVETTDGPKIFTLQGADESYRILVERMNEGAVTFTNEGLILYANQRFADMVACPLDSAIGASLRAFIHEEDATVFDALVERATQSDSRGELRLVRADGEKCRVSLSFSPVDGAEGRIMSAVASDMSGAEWTQELAASEQLARSILEQAAEAVIVCDQTERVIRASRSSFRLAGRNPLQQPFAAVFPLLFDDGSAGSVNGAVRETDWLMNHLKQGQSIHAASASLLRPDGRFELLVSARPLTSEDANAVIGAVISLVDVTERQQARERILLQQEAIRELSTPVLSVRDRLLIVPLIGAVDSARARQLTEQLLKAIRRERARVVVVDLTGVPTVDTHVAGHLINTAEAVRLLGSELILTGISSAIAATLVTIGVNLTGIMTMGDLRSGIEEAEKLLNGGRPRENAR